MNGTSFRRIRVGKIMFNNGWSSARDGTDATCPRSPRTSSATRSASDTRPISPRPCTPRHTSTAAARRCAPTIWRRSTSSIRARDANADADRDAAAADRDAGRRPGRPVDADAHRDGHDRRERRRPRTPTRTAADGAERDRDDDPVDPDGAERDRDADPHGDVDARTATPPPRRPNRDAAAAATSTPTTPRAHQVRGHVRYYSTARGVPNVTVNLHGESGRDADVRRRRLRVRRRVPEGWELAAEKASDFGAASRRSMPPTCCRRSPTCARSTPRSGWPATPPATDSSARSTRAHPAVQRRHDGAAAGGRHLRIRLGLRARSGPDAAAVDHRSDHRGGTCSAGKIMLEDLLEEPRIRTSTPSCSAIAPATGDAGSARARAPGARRARACGSAMPTASGSACPLPVYVRTRRRTTRSICRSPTIRALTPAASCCGTPPIAG